jgi:hypothetical protein
MCHTFFWNALLTALDRSTKILHGSKEPTCLVLTPNQPQNFLDPNQRKWYESVTCPEHNRRKLVQTWQPQVRIFFHQCAHAGAFLKIMRVEMWGQAWRSGEVIPTCAKRSWIRTSLSALHFARVRLGHIIPPQTPPCLGASMHWVCPFMRVKMWEPSHSFSQTSA